MSRFAAVIKAVATFAFMQGSANMSFQGSQEVEVVKSVQGRFLRKSERGEEEDHQNGEYAKKDITQQALSYAMKNREQTRDRCCYGCAALMALKEGLDCCYSTSLTPGHGTCGITDYFGYAGAAAFFAVFVYFAWAVWAAPEAQSNDGDGL